MAEKKNNIFLALSAKLPYWYVMKDTDKAEKNDPNANYGMYEADREAKRKAQPALRAVTGGGEASRDKRYSYKTAWTLVGGNSFTSQQCVAVRYIGLGQYRINETAETLHECHLTDLYFSTRQSCALRGAQCDESKHRQNR